MTDNIFDLPPDPARARDAGEAAREHCDNAGSSSQTAGGAELHSGDTLIECADCGETSTRELWDRQGECPACHVVRLSNLKASGSKIHAQEALQDAPVHHAGEPSETRRPALHSYDERTGLNGETRGTLTVDQRAENVLREWVKRVGPSAVLASDLERLRVMISASLSCAQNDAREELYGKVKEIMER